MHIKYNKLYISREDRKNRVIRSERIKDFERSLKMDKINERMKRIDNMQKDRYLLEEERRIIENEMDMKKSVMLQRLQKVMKDDEINMTKDEILNYVINDVKPGHKNKNEDNNKNNSKENNKENDIKDNYNNVPGTIEDNPKNK